MLLRSRVRKLLKDVNAVDNLQKHFWLQRKVSKVDVENAQQLDVVESMPVTKPAVATAGEGDDVAGWDIPSLMVRQQWFLSSTTPMVLCSARFAKCG